jgi:hypothetical protein
MKFRNRFRIDTRAAKGINGSWKNRLDSQLARARKRSARIGEREAKISQKLESNEVTRQTAKFTLRGSCAAL